MKKKKHFGYLLVALVAFLAASCSVYRTFRVHTEVEKAVIDYQDSVQQFKK